MGIMYIDDNPIEFQPGDNVLEAARRAGMDVPYFCYHSALGAAGSCRICAMETVPQKEGERARTVMTCSIAAQEGQRYKSQSSKAKQIQKGVIEFYMTNHPNDCPVCDEGGECHLQDTTISVGHAYRRYDGIKRTMPNQELGPLVYQTMNRCVTCYRCVRFYQDYALGDDFGVMGSSNHVLFRRTEDGAFDSPFSGNLISVCPTGVFTDKVYRRKYSRSWMLDKAASICAGCSVGCGIEAGGRAGTLRRIHPSEKSEVNPYFICDRGRYGAHASEADDRPLQLMQDGLLVQASTDKSTVDICGYLTAVLHESQGTVGILGSVEEDLLTNIALQQLALRIKAPFSPFITPAQEAQTKAAIAMSVDAASNNDIEEADLVLVIGELTEHAPMLDLAVRQVLKQHRPVYIIHAAPSHLVTASIKYNTGMNYCCAPSQWLSLLQSLAQACAGRTVETIWANLFAVAVQKARKIVIVGVAELLDIEMIEAINALAVVLGERAKIALALPAAGSMAAALVAQSDSCQHLIQQVEAEQLDTLVVVGSDPFGEAPQIWSILGHKIKRLVVADKVNTVTVERANSVIPLAAWTERNGLAINYEGRLQVFSQAFNRNQPLLNAEALIQSLTAVDQKLVTDFVNKLVETVPQAGDVGVHLTAEGKQVTLSAQERQWRFNFASSQKPQAVLSRWHGEGYIANHAHALQLIKPTNSVHLSQILVEQLDLGNGDHIVIQNGNHRLERMVIVNPQVGDHCVPLSRTDLLALDADIGSELEITKVATLFTDASITFEQSPLFLEGEVLEGEDHE